MFKQMWNSFVESSEEEQWKILNYRGLHDIKEDSEEEAEAEAPAQTAEDNWVMILDERSGKLKITGLRYWLKEVVSCQLGVNSNSIIYYIDRMEGHVDK